MFIKLVVEKIYLFLSVCVYVYRSLKAKRDAYVSRLNGIYRNNLDKVPSFFYVILLLQFLLWKHLKLLISFSTGQNPVYSRCGPVHKWHRTDCGGRRSKVYGATHPYSHRRAAFGNEWWWCSRSETSYSYVETSSVFYQIFLSGSSKVI